jgi:hypothetical protein
MRRRISVRWALRRSTRARLATTCATGCAWPQAASGLFSRVRCARCVAIPGRAAPREPDHDAALSQAAVGRASSARTSSRRRRRRSSARQRRRAGLRAGARLEWQCTVRARARQCDRLASRRGLPAAAAAGRRRGRAGSPDEHDSETLRRRRATRLPQSSCATGDAQADAAPTSADHAPLADPRGQRGRGRAGRPRGAAALLAADRSRRAGAAAACRAAVMPSPRRRLLPAAASPVERGRAPRRPGCARRCCGR